MDSQVYDDQIIHLQQEINRLAQNKEKLLINSTFCTADPHHPDCTLNQKGELFYDLFETCIDRCYTKQWKLKQEHDDIKFEYYKVVLKQVCDKVPEHDVRGLIEYIISRVPDNSDGCLLYYYPSNYLKRMGFE